MLWEIMNKEGDVMMYVCVDDQGEIFESGNG